MQPPADGAPQGPCRRRDGLVLLADTWTDLRRIAAETATQALLGNAQTSVG